MLVFYTKLFLKTEITESNIDNLILKWVTGSPHFHFDNLQENLQRRENDEQEIESREKKQKFYSLHYDNTDTTVHVLSLIHI